MGKDRVLKFAANLTFLFTELEFLDRFDAAKSAGFDAVEFPFPYRDDPMKVRERLDALNLKPVVINFPPGDWAAGDRGLACIPERINEFRQSIETGLRYAKTIGCKKVHCMAGLRPTTHDVETINQTYLRNLHYAANRSYEMGVQLLIEPLNTDDTPGYHLHHTRDAVAIINEIGSKKIALQYDVYHMQIMEKDLASTIEKNLHLIGHIQIADAPGRHEPGTGAIDFRSLLRRLEEIGYSGWIGCEYFPSRDTLSSLSWRENVSGDAS